MLMSTKQDQVTTILLIANLHCPSCSRTISEILWSLSPSPLSVSTSVLSRIVTVVHSPALLPREIVQALVDAEFEVDSIALRDGAQATDPNFTFEYRESVLLCPDARGWLEEEARKLVRSVARRSTHRQGDRHLLNCEACRAEIGRLSLATYSDTTGTSPRPGPRVPSRLSSRLSSRISSPRYLSDDPEKDGPILNAEGRQKPPNDNPEPARTTYKALISIGGMTCSVCSGKVTETLQALDWVTEASVSLMNNSALVVFDSVGDGQEEAANLVDEIENIGYEATLDRLTHSKPPSDAGSASDSYRQVALLVTGMHCQTAAENIVAALDQSFGEMVEVVVQPTVRSPMMRICYTPSPPDVTIREIIRVISAVDAAFDVSVFHPPTLEERSRRIQRKERNNYLIRMFFTMACAIPTFLIGVVWMAFVPSSNPRRIYFETAIWAGNVSRLEWTLLIISTPVMFYAAHPFHTRAMKEIMALWRPGSPVPVLRRFYRFGSMNLLISLGVSISYFSSIAMLVLAATRNTHHSGTTKGHTTTYFDSTVFLTMFLLMGERSSPCVFVRTTLLTSIVIGRALEAWSKSKTADGVNLLAGLRPKEAMMVEPVTEHATRVDIEKSLGVSPAQDISSTPEYTDGRPVATRKVPVDFLEIGDIVSIALGSSPPADGIVVAGTSNFDESSLTGEPLLIPKSPGDTVYAGTINHGQVINARVVKIGGETLLDEIVNVVREGQNKHAPIERIADKVTAYFVPCICFLAVTTWILWLSFGLTGTLPPDYLDIDEGGWYLWSLSFAIAVFVVACPCGIGLAAPCALHVGTSLAARYGILAKGGGEAFQEASLLDCVVFDKTGTLTQGIEPVITDEEVFFRNDSAAAIIYLAARLLEEGSTHPLARAMVNHCQNKPVASGRCLVTEEIAGKGSKGTIEANGDLYEAVIGNERFMDEHDVMITPQNLSRLNYWKQEGKSVILLAARSKDSSGFSSKFELAAIFATADPIRGEAPFVVDGLRRSGIDVWMITGDNAITASAVATAVGIPQDRVIAGVLPTEKVFSSRNCPFQN
jgi:Cu+-exporting ATPase